MNFKDTENKPKTSKKETPKKSDSDSESEKKIKKSEIKPRYNTWSHQETAYLMVGVKLFGKGNWTRILEKFKVKFGANRTSVHLKDKYRTLERNRELKLYEKEANKLIKEIQESDYE